MFEVLDQPYIFNNNFKHNLKTIGFVTIGLMLILLYFQPFGINFLASTEYGYFVLGLGIINGILLFFNTLLLPGLLPGIFNVNRWTLRKEIIWNIWMFIVLSAGFVFFSWFCQIVFDLELPLFKIGALAMLPVVLLNIMNYNSSLKKGVANAIDLKLLKKLPVREENVTIVSDNGKDAFKTNPQNIILIRSSSNYIEIYWKEGDVVKKRLQRNTLLAVENSLMKYTNFKKCHRCWIVNLDLVKGVKGNSQGYRLEVPGLEFNIPVSRRFYPFFRDYFSSNVSSST